MAVAERPERRRKNGTRASREYVITVGSSDEDDARDQLLAFVPTTLDGLPRLDNECEVEEIEDMNGTFYGTAVWGNAQGFEFQPPDSFELSFDVDTETAHVTHSLETVASFPGGIGTDPDFKQAINVTPEGEVEGADIVVPHLGYQFTLTVDDADMSNAYVLLLSDIVGTVNDATFHGFATGELLLMRACGQRRQDGNWNLTFGYSVSRNKTGMTIGDVTGVDKEGWDFLWVRYKYASDLTNAVLMKIPAYVYVEKVYERTDHNDIFP